MKNNGLTEPKYKTLEKPEFTCKVGETVLSKLQPEQRYLVETISAMEDRGEWLVAQVLENRRIAVENSNRISELVRWQRKIVKNVILWLLILVMGTLVGTVVRWAATEAMESLTEPNPASPTTQE